MPLSNKSLTVVASATLSACLLAGGIATIASTLPAEEGATVLPVDGVTGTPRDSIADDTEGPEVGGAGAAPVAQSPAVEPPASQTPAPQSPEAAAPVQTEPGAGTAQPGASTIEVPPAAPVAAIPATTAAARFDRGAAAAALHHFAVRFGTVDCPEWLRVAGAGLGKIGGAAPHKTATPHKTAATTGPPPPPDATTQRPTSNQQPAPTKPNEQSKPNLQPAPAPPTHETTSPQPSEQTQQLRHGGRSDSDRGWHKQSPQQHGSDRGHRDSGGSGWGGHQRGGGRG